MCSGVVNPPETELSSPVAAARATTTNRYTHPGDRPVKSNRALPAATSVRERETGAPVPTTFVAVAVMATAPPSEPSASSGTVTAASRCQASAVGVPNTGATCAGVAKDTVSETLSPPLEREARSRAQ